VENLFPFENINTLTETASEIAKNLFLHDGFLGSIFLGYTSNNKNRLFLPISWNTEEEQDQQLETVAALFCAYNINKYVFLNEVTIHRYPDSAFDAWDDILGKRVVSTKYLSVTVVTKKKNQTVCYEVKKEQGKMTVADVPIKYENLDNKFCNLLVSYDKMNKRKLKSLIKQLEQDGKLRFDVLESAR